jgi:hypothetical protein
VAGLSLSLLLVVGLVTWLVLDDDTYVAPETARKPATAAPALADETLGSLVDAVESGRPGDAEQLAAPGDDRARQRLGELVRNARAARVDDFTLRYVDELGAVADDGSWNAAVDTSWAFRGFDEAPALSEVRFGFRLDDDQVYVTTIGGGDRRSPLWMTESLDVQRDATTLVLVGSGLTDADRYAAVARRAVPVVRAVIPTWQPRLVVEVPESMSALDRALDAEPGEYAQVAAVTSTADGSLAPDAPVHVFVNPQVFGDLRARGAQVVMSHEATHVATEAATSTMPLWLLEGFADYVALRDVPLPLSVTAGQIIADVRRDGPPAHLPGEQEFDTATDHLGATYEAAWLVCRLLAGREGEATLVDFYRDVDDGTPVGAALRSAYGISAAELTEQWQDMLQDLAA